MSESVCIRLGAVISMKPLKWLISAYSNIYRLIVILINIFAPEGFPMHE